MVEIRVGYELIYDCPQPTPMMLVLNIHYTRAADILVPDHVKTDPSVPGSSACRSQSKTEGSMGTLDADHEHNCCIPSVCSPERG